MKKNVIGLVLILTGLLTSMTFSQEPPRISKEELKTMLGDPNVTILDVRIYDEWKASGKKIQGATWKNPEKLGSWMKQFPKDMTLVFYCS